MNTHDPLKDFINSKRDDFDDKEVPIDSWGHISSSLGFRKKAGVWNNLIVWRAAAVLFMAVSIYLAVPQFKSSADINKTSLKEFSDVESFYTGEISRKVALIEELSPDESGDDFTQDFKQLEAMYLVLKEELKTRPTKKVKDALVLNLLVRINLLNQQLHKLEEDEKPQNKSI